MAKPAFARIKNGDDTYPRRSFDGGEDQSYGFTQAYKLQTGTMRGEQHLGSDKIIAQSAQQRIIVRDGNDTRVVLGKAPDGTYVLAVSKEGFDILEILEG